MAALPYMQLYVAEYLADTSHLNAIQHGAYMLLLMNYWQRGKPLPDSNGRLSIVARMTDAEWTANRGVLAEFFDVSNGVWMHHRVERDLVKVRGISNAGKIGGAASAKARKEKTLNDRSKTVERNGNQQNRTEQIQNRKDKSKDAQSGLDANEVAKTVMATLGMSSDGLHKVLTEVASHEIAAGAEGVELSVRMHDAWIGYVKARVAGKMAVTFSAEKFYGQGLWRDEALLPWKEGKAPKPVPIRRDAVAEFLAYREAYDAQ